MSAATMSEMDRVRRERDEARAERDALAAYLAQNTLLMNRFFLCEDYSSNGEGEGASDGVLVPADLVGAFTDLSATTPTTSLARLKAKWQAEAMAEALDALEYMDREVGSDRGALDATQDELRERLRGYRRQAEVGDHEP